MPPLTRGLPLLVLAVPLAACVSDSSTPSPIGCVSACFDASFDAGGFVIPDATAGDAASDAQSDAASSFDATADDGATADAGAGDSGAAEDAGGDAATSDGGASDDAGSDASDGATDAGAPDAAPPIQQCVVDLTGGTNTFLISDPGTGHIDQVSMTGTVLHTYTAPMSNVAGVAFDRRARDGFWVVGTDSLSSIAKIAWSGAALPSLTMKKGYSNLRGLDYCLRATAADDELVMVDTNTNFIDVATAVLVASGVEQFGMGFSDPTKGFQSGYWGVSLLASDNAANVLRGWFVRASSLELWQTATRQNAVSIGVADPRGLALAPNGDFWVIDATAHQVVHMSSNGTVLGGFATPGTQPAGLSFDPGP